MVSEDAFFHLSFEKGGAKELEWGVGIGFDRTDMPASFGVWAIISQSDILDL